MLASFVRLDNAESGSELRFADFGTGCGVIGLAVLLRALRQGHGPVTQGRGAGFVAASTLSPASQVPLSGNSREPSGKLLLQRPEYASYDPPIALPGGLSGPSLALHGVGYEVSSELCAAARANAEALGLAEHFRIVEHDLAVPDTGVAVSSCPSPNSKQRGCAFDFIVANPPYRLLSEGRAPASPLRRRALFEEQGSMRLFAASASQMLCEDGSFYCVYPVKREAYLVDLLPGLGLWPRRLLRVYGQPGKQAPFFLLEACKQGPGEFTELPDLVLYNGATLTEEALAFCDFLECNRSRG